MPADGTTPYGRPYVEDSLRMIYDKDANLGKATRGELARLVRSSVADVNAILRYERMRRRSGGGRHDHVHLEIYATA